jgi:hypothetical protein
MIVIYVQSKYDNNNAWDLLQLFYNVATVIFKISLQNDLTLFNQINIYIYIYWYNKKISQMQLRISSIQITLMTCLIVALAKLIMDRRVRPTVCMDTIKN